MAKRFLKGNFIILAHLVNGSRFFLVQPTKRKYLTDLSSSSTTGGGNTGIVMEKLHLQKMATMIDNNTKKSSYLS